MNHKQGDWVYVSDISEESALQSKAKRIYIKTLDVFSSTRYVCVTLDEEQKYWNEDSYSTTRWKYAVPVSTLSTKEKTMTDIEKMEQKHKELMQAAQELGDQIEKLKNSKKIVFSLMSNYGLITTDDRRYVLVKVGDRFAFKSFEGLCTGWVGDDWFDGQSIIDAVVQQGHCVVVLDSTPRAVAYFLLGE